jgi:hypothetical protein
MPWLVTAKDVAIALIGLHEIAWWQALWAALQFIVVLVALFIATRQLWSYNYRERARTTVDFIDKWHAGVEAAYARLLFDMDPATNAKEISERYTLFKPGGSKNGGPEANAFWRDLPIVVNYFSTAATLADHQVIDESIFFEMLAVQTVTAYYSARDTLSALGPDYSSFDELRGLARRAQRYHRMHPKARKAVLKLKLRK